MLERADHAGIWGQEPEATPEEIEASAKIDAQLRADRVKQIREECAVLILGPNTDASNQARWQLTAQLGGALGVDLDGNTPESDSNEAVVSGTLEDGSVVTASSFPTSKKSKSSRIRMSVADPSVLIFVAELDAADAGPGPVSVKALTKWLSHLLFTAASIGDLKQTAVCLVISNCDQLKSSLREMKFASDENFCEALGENFPETAAAEDAEDFLLSLSGELEKATLTFDPTEVRTVFVDYSLAAGPTGNAGVPQQTSEDAANLTQQVLGLLSSIQSARIAEAESMDMESKILNVVPRKPDEGAAAAPAVSSVWSSSLVKLAAFGAVSAVLVVVAMQLLDRAEENDGRRN